MTSKLEQIKHVVESLSDDDLTHLSSFLAVVQKRNEARKSLAHYERRLKNSLVGVQSESFKVDHHGDPSVRFTFTDRDGVERDVTDGTIVTVSGNYLSILGEPVDRYNGQVG